MNVILDLLYDMQQFYSSLFLFCFFEEKHRNKWQVIEINYTPTSFTLYNNITDRQTVPNTLVEPPSACGPFTKIHNTNMIIIMTN